MTNGAGFIALAALIFGRWRAVERVRGRDALRVHACARHAPADPRRRRSATSRSRASSGSRCRTSSRSSSWPGAVGPVDPAGRRRPAVRAVPMSATGRPRDRLGRPAGRRAPTSRNGRTRRTRTCRSGAAALVDDGRIVTGCNVENASYGLTLCAECGLVSALHATGGGRLVAFACVDGATATRSRRAAAAASCCGRRAARRCRSTPRAGPVAHGVDCSPAPSAPKTSRRERTRGDRHHRRHPDQARRRRRSADEQIALVPPGATRRARSPTSRRPRC